MTLDEIRELVSLVIESGVAELEVTRGDNKVRIRRNSEVLRTQEYMVAANPAALANAAAPAPQPSSPPAQPSAPVETSPKAGDETDNVQYVRSPIVGTFYEAASPDAPPFVRVGDHVTPGQVLCIIESMKLMNEIEAEVACTITGKLVENARPVEYGEALFAIRPD